jgi:tetratricopeptide (TPR) repeat protein
MMRLCILMFVACIISPIARGQENAQQQYRKAFLQEQQGQYEEAIRGFEPIVKSDALTLAERGRALTLLGYAYRETGQYQKAREAYERSLHIFEGDKEHRVDYANALDCFAGLSRSIGQPDPALRMWSQALEIYEQLNEHRGILKTYANLAGLAMEQKHLRAARSAIDKAVAETKTANEFTDDDLALVSEVQGWIAGADGDMEGAIAGAQRTVDLRKHGHGEYFPLTGWSCLILGRAYLANHQTDQALANIREGLTILEKTEGPNTPRYLAGQLLYSRALDKLGMHEEASRLKGSAEKSMNDLLRSQCVGCTLSAFSFR